MTLLALLLGVCGLALACGTTEEPVDEAYGVPSAPFVQPFADETPMPPAADTGTGGRPDAIEPRPVEQPVEPSFAPGCENEPIEPLNCGANCTALANNGPPANRVNLALIGDGFTEPEIQSAYIPHASELAAYMFTNENDSEPYVSYRRFINFYRIDLVSPESGVDDASSGRFVDTPLDGELGCSDLGAGQCGINFSKTHDAIDAAFAGSEVPGADWRLVVLNSERNCAETHYPKRGTLPVYCPYQNDSLDIALHEGGHGWSLLADTYWTRSDSYQGDEPRSVNLTTDSSGAKWQHWLGYVEPVLGEIGAYEGGGLYEWGLYRPSYNQKMGSAERCHEPGPPYCPHDAVSREKIIHDIYDIVRPLDAWSDNEQLLNDPDELSVDVVDCERVKVDWFVDGELLERDYGERFSVAAQQLDPGRYTIEARAYDDTAWVRRQRETLEQRVTWEIDLTE